MSTINLYRELRNYVFFALYFTKLGFTHKGNLPDSNYFPIFGLDRMENPIFTRRGEDLRYMQK